MAMIVYTVHSIFQTNFASNSYHINSSHMLIIPTPKNKTQRSQLIINQRGIIIHPITCSP
jgi:hypothetical protein